MRAKFGLAFGLALIVSPVVAWAQIPARPPATGFKIVPLVSDLSGAAANTDPDLVNPWGLAQAPGAPVWVSDNGTDKSTIYDRSSGAKSSLIINISPGAPTGIVYVPAGSGFVVTKNGHSGASGFIYDTESGAIEGWSGSVDTSNAVLAYDGSPNGSVYKGLALDTAQQHLLAADFTNNQVQIFDNTFTPIGGFTDPGLPKNFAPFNVAIIGGKVYVAFAKREKHGIDEVDGKHLGYVDVFDTSGNLQQHLISNGPLNAPWGMALAPDNFGTFSGALLVGNFGDGKINAFDPSTGDFLGTVSNKKGKPLKIDGLWGLDPGPGNAVTFSAGTNGEADGLLGLIQPN